MKNNNAYTNKIHNIKPNNQMKKIIKKKYNLNNIIIERLKNGIENVEQQQQ
jgi:hypothetical protein